ncbi:hypothetical protein GPALN_014654 [Globodera pallida]|nr:hypothetical protein GPALN_014654 [Globodera pallida]
MVKVGDFGISKRMSTATNIRGGAQTMLGTPYYLSPEMCAAVQRQGGHVGDGLLSSEYEPLRGPYSPDIRLIVRELFRTDPEQRPSAADLLEQIRR